MRLLPLALVLVALAAAACASRPVTGRPPIPPGVNPQHLHFSDATVGVGDVAPAFDLPATVGDGTISLADFRGKPTVLVFASHTWNVFGRSVPAVRRLYDDFYGRANFLLVYVREAHAAGEWVMPDNAARGLVVEQPTTDDARQSAARECLGDYLLSMPTAVDRMDDAVCRTYGAWPDRLYVIDPEGRIAYQGGVGPFGFSTDEVRAFLRDEYGL